MTNPDHDTRLSLDFEQSPVPGVPVEVIRYVLTLPGEVRAWLGNFLLDSTMDGFDGTPESSARLWRDELQRRVDDAEAHPERLLTKEQVFARVTARLDQLRRTPRPDNLHGYHCTDYFGDGWAERGYYDEASRSWVVEPLTRLHPEQRAGFFAVGGAGGVRFGYRFGYLGLWSFDVAGGTFRYVAPSLDALVEGWRSGAVRVP